MQNAIECWILFDSYYHDPNITDSEGHTVEYYLK